MQLDNAGNIKVCDDAYAVAQEVANKIRLFTNDAYFDEEKGIPHFVIDLGKKPMQSVVRSRIKEASLSVPEVKTVNILNIEIVDRKLSGQIELTLKNGSIVDVTI